MNGDQEERGEFRKRQRVKNLALLAALAAFVVLVYIVSLRRLGDS